MQVKRNSGLGRVYDLDSLYARLNRLYFDNRLSLQIRWSRVQPKRATSAVQLGLYCSKTKIITISKRLDNPRVPLFFLEHVIFHEMLHAVFPAERHKMHTERFRKFERMHPDFERAREWEKNSLKILFAPQQTSLWA